MVQSRVPCSPPLASSPFYVSPSVPHHTTPPFLRLPTHSPAPKSPQLHGGRYVFLRGGVHLMPCLQCCRHYRCMLSAGPFIPSSQPSSVIVGRAGDPRDRYTLPPSFVSSRMSWESYLFVGCIVPPPTWQALPRQYPPTQNPPLALKACFNHIRSN